VKREKGLVCDRLSTAAQADDAQHKKRMFSMPSMQNSGKIKAH
jgi:hypothetical protein